LNDAARQPAFPPSPASDPHLRTFLETIPQIVWTANAAGWIEWYNSRWHEYTGQTPAEAAGWGWQAAHHPDDFPKVMERWPHSVATGETFEMEFRLRRRDGAFRWMLTRVVPLRDEAGNVVRWYGSNTDIDDQKRQIERAARIARTMREAFVPERLPERDDLYFDAVYLPADRDALVGGDWYDAVTLPDGRILISCGEVAGDGLEAAILAGSFRLRITATGLEDPEPARLLSRVNRIAMLQDRSTATAVVGLFDPRERTLRYALAGHPPPVFAAADGSARIAEHGGPPIGASHEAAWRTTSVDVEPGAVVVFYTDGLVACARARDVAAAERALADAHGVPSGARFLHPGPVAFPIALAPGEIAAATIRWTDGNVFGSTSARRIVAASLALTLGRDTLATPLLATVWGRQAVTFDQERFTTALPPLGPPSQAVVGTFLGEGPAGSTYLFGRDQPARRLLLTHAPGGALRFSFDGVGAALSTGSIQGSLTLRDARAVYDDARNDCDLSLSFFYPQLVVTQRGTCGFGNGVTAAGHYQRI